jgi:predicted nucleotidyltransferase
MTAERLLDLVREHRDEVQAAVERHHGLSAARGEDSEFTDIDILVRFAPGSSLFNLAHLSDELERPSAAASMWFPKGR